MLNSEELKYKEFINLQKRLNELSEKLRDLPNVKLDKPYQRGWVIQYDVRDDIKNREDYPLIKEALEKGWYDSYTNDVKVVRAIRKNDKNVVIKGKWSSRIISHFYPKRKEYSEGEYKSFVAINKFYVLDESSERYRKYGRKLYHCQFPSYWLKLKVRPNMITHRYLKGGELESEYELLRYRLYWSGEFSSFVTNYGKSYPAYKDRTKIRAKIRKFINGSSDDIYNDKIPLEYEY